MTFLVRKLLGLIVVLLVVSAVVYFLGRGVVPEDIGTIFVGRESVTPKERAEIEHNLGLDKPLYVAYIEWLGNAVTGELGTSPLTGRTVTSVIAQTLPVSLELAALSLLLTILVGVPLGVTGAVHAGGKLDLVFRTTALAMFAIPVFVTAIILLLLSSLYFPTLYQVQYTPLTDSVVGNLQCMLLPAISVALPLTAITMQMTRATMLDALREPHIGMARAKGVSERRIAYVHALKNATPAILTVIAFLFGILIGGLVIVETVFNLPGMGSAMIQALMDRDFQLLVPLTVILAAVFVLANTLVEVVHPIIDPRVRPS